MPNLIIKSTLRRSLLVSAAALVVVATAAYATTSIGTTITIGTSGSYQALDSTASESGYAVFGTSPMATATSLRGVEARVKTTGGTHPSDGFLQAGRFAATMDTGTTSLEEAWGINSTLGINAGTLNAAYGTVGDLSICGDGACTVVVDGAVNSGVFGVYGQSYVRDTGVTFTNSAIDAPLAGFILANTGRRKADAGVASILQGAINQATTGAGAAFKAYDFNTTAAFDYGLDLYYSSGSYSNVFGTADIRLQNAETISNATDGGVKVSGWIQPYTEGTTPNAVDPTGPVEGSIAVDSGEQDCFAAADGTDGGSLCVYSGAAWIVVKTW